MVRSTGIFIFLSLMMVACKDAKEAKPSVAASPIEFKIEGAVERIDSAYSSGLHRVSTFFDKANNERIAYVKFHDNGQPYTDMRFQSGVRNGVSWSYYKNGNPWSMHVYLNDTLHGEYKTWYENGQLYQQTFYNKGKEEGEWIKYYPSGRLDTRGFFTRGEKSGVWTTYNMEGKLMREIDYSKKQ